MNSFITNLRNAIAPCIEWIHDDISKYIFLISYEGIFFSTTAKNLLTIISDDEAYSSVKELLEKCGPTHDNFLLESNKDASNFIFKIEGINDSQMRHINSLDKFKQKFDYIREIGGLWSFSKISGETLRNNLIMLDLGMGRIVADCMEKYYTGQGSEVASTCRKVAQEDPLHINSPEGQPMYAYKIKQFLLAFALGMTVSSPWDGSFNANGGYIVVKEDGDVVCYHFFDRNDLEEYLFNNTKFDTPSTTRHEFGEIYKIKDSYFIKLNLQIRFIK